MPARQNFSTSGNFFVFPGFRGVVLAAFGNLGGCLHLLMTYLDQFDRQIRLR